MVSRVLTNRREVKKTFLPTKMVKGKRRTEAAPRCLTRSNAGGSSSPALCGSLDGPKAAKDSRLDIPATNGAVAKCKKTAVTANGSISKGARALANSRDIITNYFSPARSPVTADDAESLPDSTTNSSKASSACSMNPHSGSLQHNMKTARLARTNSIDTQQHNCVSIASTGDTDKDSHHNQLHLVGRSTNSDEVETVSLVSSNDDLEEVNNIHCRHPPVIDDSTTNPPLYKYHLHSRQQNHHHQQHQSSPVTAACNDAAVVSATADSMSAAVSFPSVADVDGCVAGKGSDTDDDCVVIEDDDSDYNVPYQKTSKTTNNFNGFTTSSTATTRSLRSVRCLKNHTPTSSTITNYNNSHLINNTPDANVPTTTTITITATKNKATDVIILPCGAGAAAVADFSEVKEVNDIISSSSSSSSCCSCCSSTRSICSENITAGACTLTICDSSSKVNGMDVASLNVSTNNRCKSDSVGAIDTNTGSLWRSLRKNNHQQALLVTSNSGNVANTNGWAALVQEKRDVMMVALGNKMVEETISESPQHFNNEAVNRTIDYDCLSSKEITTRGLRSSPSKAWNNLHSSSTRKSPSSSTSPNHSLRNCSNSHNAFKSNKRDYFSSPGADGSADDEPLLVDLTSPNHVCSSNNSYLSPKLSHSSPSVKQFFTADTSSKTSPSSSASASSESPFSISTSVKNNNNLNSGVSIQHGPTSPSSPQPRHQSSDIKTTSVTSLTVTSPSSPATPSTPHKIQVLLEEDPSDELFLSSPTAATAMSRLSVLSPGDRAARARGWARGKGRARGRGRKRLNVDSVSLDCDRSNIRDDSSPPRTSHKADQNNHLTSGVDDDASSVTSPINGYMFRRSRTRSPFKANGFLMNSSSLEEQSEDQVPNHMSVSPEKVNGMVKPLTRTSKLQQQAHQETIVNTLDGRACPSKQTAASNNNRSGRPVRALRTASENVGVNTVELKTAVNKSKAASVNDPAPVGGRNMQMTDYFPIRRSERKPKATLLYERQMDIEKKILEGSEEGLRVENFGEKGRGVVTTRLFRKGEFVVEYVGELLDMKDAKDRETKYSQDTSKGCYMYYFTYNDVQYCIDGTEETGYLGRLVNHSRTSNNLVTKSVLVDGRPHLILVAKKDILPGTELLYDYGDRSKEALANHPWLAL